MDFEHPDVANEYRRWLDLVGNNDPYAGKETVGLHEVLKAHFLIVDFFTDQQRGVGGVGPKSMDLLHSAIYRQFVSYGGKDKWALPIEKSATLLYGLVKDHPFYDANKRTAFLVTLHQLHRLSRTPSIKQKEFEDFVVDIAENNLTRHGRYRLFDGICDDPEIHFIADYLKRNTREIDTRQYTVTFHELQKILRKYSFELVNPSGNYIDVVEVSYRSRFLGLGSKKRVENRVAQVGFPGWKKQVTKAALKTIREKTGLTATQGIDSKTFFQGAEPLYSLIDEFEGPLRRLADR